MGSQQSRGANPPRHSLPATFWLHDGTPAAVGATPEPSARAVRLNLATTGLPVADPDGTLRVSLLGDLDTALELANASLRAVLAIRGARP